MKIELSKQDPPYNPKHITITIETQEEEDTLRGFGNICGADLYELLQNNKHLKNSLKISLKCCTDFVTMFYQKLVK